MAAIQALGTAVFNTSSGTHTVTASPSVGDLIVIVIASTSYTGTTAPTDNNPDGLGTYTLAQSNVKASSADKQAIYVRDSPIGSASSTVFTHAPGATTGGGLGVLNVTGMQRFGAGAIRQAAGQDNVAGPSAPATTFAAAALTGNPIIDQVFNVTNPAGVTAPVSGTWTSEWNTGYTVPGAGMKCITADSGITTATITWGSTTSAYCTSAVELDASPIPASMVRRRAAAHHGLVMRGRRRI